MSPRHARAHCTLPSVGEVRTELRSRHWIDGYTTLLRGEINTPYLPETRPQQDDPSVPTPDLLRAVLDGLRKL